jgi:hypothetical protein
MRPGGGLSSAAGHDHVMAATIVPRRTIELGIRTSTAKRPSWR